MEDKENNQETVQNSSKQEGFQDSLSETSALSLEKDAQIRELTLTLQRLQAEFENYKKRTDKEKVEFTKLAERRVITDLLGVVDNFELALKNKSSEQHDELVQGIEMIYTQLCDLLHKRGLTALETVGSKFDPYKHQALMEEASDQESGTILEEFQKGYMLHDTLIRHAKVKVSKTEVLHESSSQERVHHKTNAQSKNQGDR